MRCHDCNQRFLIPEVRDSLRVPKAALLGGLIVVVFALVTAGVLWQAPTATRQAVAAIPAPPVNATKISDPEQQFLRASYLLADAEINMTYSAEAIDLLQRAAERGHAQAMLRLGTLYRSGFGAVQNFSLAAKWIERAAHEGEPQAMLELGRLYREGIGMPKDMIKAYVWLNRAAAARNADAARERADVARNLTADELRFAQDESSIGGLRSPPAAAVARPAAGTPAASR